MSLHRNLATVAVLAMALAGCNLQNSDKQVRNTNPVPQNTNPIATQPATGAGWGAPSWGDYRSSAGCTLSC